MEVSVQTERISRAAILIAAMLTASCAVKAPTTAAVGTACETRAFIVSDNFDGARRGICRISGDAEVELAIMPEDPGEINPSPWFAFKIEPKQAATATIRLTYQDVEHRYKPKVSVDGLNWATLADDQVEISADGRSAMLSLDLEAETFWVAAQELLLPSMYRQWTERMASEHKLELSELGRSMSDRPVHMLRVDSPSDDVLMLVGRQHPPEVSGAIAFLAFFEALMADTPTARAFRERFDIVAVPMINPDGVIAGHWRHNLGGTDLNRDWGPFTQPETQLMRDLLHEIDDQGQSIRVFLDFHSTSRNVFYTQDDDNPTVPPNFTETWLDNARPRLPDYEFDNDKNPTDKIGVSKNYMHKRYGIPASTYEVGDETDRDLARSAAAVFADELMQLMLQPLQYDILISNGTVYDGTQSAGRIASIGIIGDRIVSVDAARSATAKRVIDASGKIVAPGFIDPHTHATRYLRNPDTAANLNYLMQGVTTVVIGSDGYGVPGGQDTLALFESHGVGPNVAFLAGHGQVRKATMGLADRAANDSEVLAMQALVEEAMQAGAIGLSTGLYYAPGSYAETSEVVELAKVAAAYGGIYDTHMRSEGSQGSGVIDALDEAISIGRDAGIAVHISHIKALGKDSWQHSQSLINRIEAARADGLSVTANQYPWRASGTRFSSALIPRWVLADSKEHMRERLANPELQPRILAEMRANLDRRGGADAMLVTHADSAYAGMTLTQIATQLQVEPGRAAIEVVLQGDPSIASFVMQQHSIEQLAMQPWVMTGSDGSSGHPRLYGTYPKAWRDFVVDKPLMTAEQFIHRSSGLTADTLGLCRRGYLRTGYLADIVIFDPQSFRSNANYQNPTKLASGVSQVLVNGVVVIDGEHTETLPGRVLRKTEC